MSRAIGNLVGSGAIKNNKGQPINKLQSKLAVILCAGFFASSACADVVFDSVGIIEADSVKKFSGLRQHGVSLSYRVRDESTKFWIPSSLDIAAGWLERDGDTASFISIGPSYRMHLNNSDWGRLFADFGAHPTYVSDTNFGGKSLGGKFFFTSYLGVGAYLDRQRRTSLSLRYQHTSNGGLSHANPGVDMLGLTLSYHFGADQRLLSAATADQN